MAKTISMNQVKKKVMEWIEQRVMWPAEAAVYLTIAKDLVRKGKCTLNNMQLARAAGVSDHHVINVMRRLEKLGLVACDYKSARKREIQLTDFGGGSDGGDSGTGSSLDQS